MGAGEDALFFFSATSLSHDLLVLRTGIRFEKKTKKARRQYRILGSKTFEHVATSYITRSLAVHEKKKHALEGKRLVAHRYEPHIIVPLYVISLK